MRGGGRIWLNTDGPRQPRVILLYQARKEHPRPGTYIKNRVRLVRKPRCGVSRNPTNPERVIRGADRKRHYLCEALTDIRTNEINVIVSRLEFRQSALAKRFKTVGRRTTTGTNDPHAAIARRRNTYVTLKAVRIINCEKPPF